MRVLLLGPKSKNTVTGVSLAFDLLIEGLKERNVDFNVVDFAYSDNSMKSGSYNFKSAWHSFRALMQTWMKLIDSDIFYTTMSTSRLGFIRDYMAVGVSHLFRKKVIMHLHGGGFEDFYKSSSKWIKFLIRQNLKRVDTIIVLGELLKDQFDCVSSIVKNKLSVVPNGLTLGVTDPKADYKSIRHNEIVNLVYLSSLMPSKGFMDVILAVEILKKQSGKKYHLDICGNFVNAITEEACGLKNHQDLLAYIKENNLEEEITYHGQVLGASKEALLDKAHIFLLPTYYPWEGQPLSIIEALAYATPIISCKHKGICEMIEEGENGHFVLPKDPCDIAKKIEVISYDTNLYTEYSKKSRIKFEKEFQRSVHLNRLINEILIV